MDVATVNGAASGVTIHEPKVKVDLTKFVESHRFMFDEVFDEGSTNEDIYATTCKPLVSFFLNKGKATCFAYGQTGLNYKFSLLYFIDYNLSL
jgi:kinesin family protein 2/24